MRSLAAPRALKGWILFGSLIGFASCAQPPIEIGPAIPYPGDWSTPLPAGVSSNPATFGADSADLIAGPVVERLRDGANCGGCKVLVRIRTTRNTRTVDPNSPPSPGRQYAHITNLDPTHVEAYYGLKPESQADYYLWIGPRPDRSDSTLITIVEVPKAPAGVVRAGRQKKMQLCHSGHSGPNKGVDFVEYQHPMGCDYPLVSGERNIGAPSLLSVTGFFKFLSHSAANLGLTPPTSLRDAWIDCNSGCCT